MAAPAAPAVSTRSRRPVDLALVILGAVVTGAALMDLLGVVSMTSGLVAINALTGDLTARQPLTSLPQIIQAQLAPDASGDLSDVGVGLRLLCAAPTVAHLITIVVAGLLMARIIGHIQEGRPFSSEVLRGWNLLGGALVVGGGLQTALSMVAVGVLSVRLSQETDPYHVELFGAAYSVIGIAGPDVPWMLLLLGIIAGAVALAFRKGSMLEDEVVGVV